MGELETIKKLFWKRMLVIATEEVVCFGNLDTCFRRYDRVRWLTSMT